MSLGTLLLALLPAQAAAQAQPIPIAVTASGLRVECLQAATGDRAVETPFGRLALATDPVAEVSDGREQLDRLLALHRAGQLDDFGLLLDLSTAGQLSALADHARDLARRDPARLEPYLALEAWGARADPVPRDTPREKRVAFLWRRVLEGSWHETVLAGARLREEASEAFQAPSEQVVSIADMRKALRHGPPQQRRAAALVAGKQQEFGMRELILVLSLSEPDFSARDGACWAADRIHPHAARNYWARNLARGEAPMRGHAALALGRHAGPEGLRILVHVLAAHDRRPPERFEFAGREIWVVAEADRFVRGLQDFDLERPDRDLRPLPINHEYVDLGSTFKVTRYREDLCFTLLQALDEWAGERTGRTMDGWLAWYLENHPPRNAD